MAACGEAGTMSMLQKLLANLELQDGTGCAHHRNEWSARYLGQQRAADLLGWSRKDLCSEFGIGGASRPGDFGMGWVGESGAGKRDWANETEQDREFGTGKRDWPSKYSIGDVNQQDVVFSTSQRDWARGTELMGDSSVESTDWLSTYGSGDADQRDREFNASNPDWSSTYSIGSADNQDRELSARQPDWPSTYGIEDTDKKTSDYGASKPDWTSEYNQRAADRQDREFGASKPAWPTEYHPRDAELSARQAEWPNEYCLREAPQQSREFSAGKPDWSSDYGIDQTGQEREFRVRSRDQTSEFGVGDSELCAQKPVWRDECSLSDTDQQDFAAASRDWAKDFCTGGAERENQFGAIGKDWAGSFGFSTSDPVDSAEATNNQTDWAGDFRTGAPDEPRGVGEGQSDQARDVRDMDISSDLTVGSSAMPRESGEVQSDWACNLGLGSQAVASGLGDVGSEEPREAGVGQIDCTCKYSVGSTDTSDTRAASSVESKEASVAQMDWASGPGIEHSDQSYRFGGGILDGDEDQHPGTKGNSEDSLVGRPCSPQCSSNSHMLANSVTREAAVERPASFQSSHSEVERGPGNSADDPPPVAEKAWPYPFPLDEEDRLQPDGGAEASQSHSGDGNGVSMGTRKPSQPDQGGQEDHTMEGPGALVGPDFAFLEDAEVLDSAVYRDRANLGRKRGHRPPAIRPVGAMGLSETDRDSWMFEDSTEPQAVRAASSDEEAVEEPRSRRARTSPVLKGVKVPLFPSLSPSALKAKLRGRNRSAEEGALQGEVKQSSSKEVHVQRSKSCKIPSLSGKPLVLPPKPEKSSGSETTSPHWLQALKLKKKKS
uniref:Tankyrase 1-binding protein C-terminal domain-containing protein n=1 Tax=Sphenodon punctatus TaxID=8508 RepID=A0A8D0L9E8_SPHPU